MRSIKLVFGITCLVFTSCLWAIEHKLKPDELLTLPISDSGPSRIFFEQQKVTEVFFYPEEAAKVVLHKSGAVFVVPLQGQKQVFLTLMSEEGLTQDLKLNYVKKQPEPIKLQQAGVVSIVPQNNLQNLKGAKK